MHIRRTSGRLTLGLVLLAAVAACDDGGSDREITGSRTYRTAKPLPPQAPFDDSVRFGPILERMRDAHAQSRAHADGTAPAASAGRGSAIGFDVPEGWAESDGGSMRIASFRVSGRPGVDVSVTSLPGDGGGAAANVNRWRTQMGLAPITGEQAAALPRVPVLGRDALLVRLEGTYTGMGNAEPAPGSGLLGAVVPLPMATLFVKMTGPAADVKAEEDRFAALCRSIRLGGAPTGGAPAGGAHGGTAPAAEAPLELRPVLPEGWTKGGQRPVRLATYHPGGREELDCSLVVLAGDGGGTVANVNRWRKQLGQDAISAAEVETLPRIRVLGKSCPLVEAEGHYTGMGNVSIRDGMLLGVMVPLERRTLYVKLTGAADAVRVERENFVAFCTSLRQVP